MPRDPVSSNLVSPERGSDAALAAITDADQVLRSIIESSADHIIVINRNYEIMYINRTVRDLTVADVLGRPIHEFVPPAFRRGQIDCFARVFETGVVDRFETEYQTRDGETLYFEARVAPLTRSDQIVALVVNSTDITERKRGELRLRVLLDELDHRVRNNLASILSLIDLTASTSESVAEFDERLTRRVKTIALTHDLLAHPDSIDANSIERLIRSLLEHHGVTDTRRVIVRGPLTAVSSRVAGSIAICINELAMNAEKHGALRSPTGRIEIGWRLTGEGRMQLEWIETTHGPIEAEIEPKPHGGLDLIRGLVAHDLNGRADLELTPTGLHATIDFPLGDRAGGESQHDVTA